MERKLVTSVINEILRYGFDNEGCVLDGIALVLCRLNEPSISTRFKKDYFDYEELFKEGDSAAQQIEKHIPQEQLRLLNVNFALTAEVLYSIYPNKAYRPLSSPFSVKELTSRFLFHLLDPKAETVVYNPFGGDIYAPKHNPFIRFESTSMDSISLRFAQLIQVARGLGNVNYYISDPFINPDGETKEYDRIYIPDLTFGSRLTGAKRRTEATFILDVLKRLRPGGKMVFALTTNALASNECFELRKALLEMRILRSIILLNSKNLSDSYSISTATFIVENTRNEDSHFYLHDLSKIVFGGINETQTLADQVLSKDSLVSVAIDYATPFTTHNVQFFNPTALINRLDRPGFKYVKLGSLLKAYSNPVELDGTEMVARLSGKDMHLALPNYLIDIQDVEITPAKGRFTCIAEQVLCFHGITLNSVWCVGEADLPIYCNSDIYTFQIKDDLITPEYLCFVLGQEDVKADIKSRVVTTYIPRIPRKSFLDVAIPVPDRDRQDLVRQDIQQFISEQKTKIVEAEQRSHMESIDDIREDIKDKVHLMSPYDSCISAGLDRIRTLLEEGVSLQADTRVYKKLNISFLDFIKDLYNKSVSSAVILESMGGSIFDPALRPIDSFTFLQEYIASLRRDSSLGDIAFELEPIDTPFALRITQKPLQFALDTIVRNAVSHGFNPPFFGEKRVRFCIKSAANAQMAVLSIANNGNPVDSKFNESLYGEKGGMCGRYAHSGRGGYFVRRAMDYYGGYFRIDTSNENWPFIINLFIPVSHE